MGTYIYEITAIALIGSIITVICPTKFSKLISFVVGLSLIIAITNPFTKFITDIKNDIIHIHESNISVERKNDDIKKIGAKSLASSIMESIAGKYGKSDANTKIIINTDDNEAFNVISAEVYIKNCNFDISLAEKYLSNLYGFNITIYDK